VIGELLDFELAAQPTADVVTSRLDKTANMGHDDRPPAD
jgi:hypothetical protein